MRASIRIDEQICEAARRQHGPGTRVEVMSMRQQDWTDFSPDPRREQGPVPWTTWYWLMIE